MLTTIKKTRTLCLITICFCLLACNNEKNGSIQTSTCKNTPGLLEKIKNSDQNDRKTLNIYDTHAMSNLIKHDTKRRAQVANIFASGCLNSAKDYANAALVFQHGTHPDHFYQTYIWAKKAVSLGKTETRTLIADAIDRYLINTGYKQIYGTQTLMPSNSMSCFCLQPIEKNIPASLRKKYFSRSIQDQFKWLKELNQGKSCPNQECKILELKPVNKNILVELGIS